jgi:predicted AAA+ superfamily ATPase
VLKQLFSDDEAHYMDLLDSELFLRLLKKPNMLDEIVASLPKQKKWVLIDEVQKVPLILDHVHRLIETTQMKFALTGSSARKLKREGANLLAARAFVNNLYPLSYLELGEDFILEDSLAWGMLPKIFEFNLPEEKYSFLTTYVHTYLKEEILQEQLVRNLDPFSKFLEVSAQMNGKIINYSKIGLEIGSSPNTVQTYFDILVDTLIGNIIPAYNISVRKQQKLSPKFYFIDSGIQRALAGNLTVAVQPSTYSFGNQFEGFVINEIIKLNQYHKKDYKLSYLMTKDSVEIDLIIQRPGETTVLLEIKSGNAVAEKDLKNLHRLSQDIKNSVGYCLSNDPIQRDVGDVKCFPWRQGLKALGLTKPQF